MPEGPTHDPLKAQLRSDSGRSSKLIKDRQGIEAIVGCLERASWCCAWTAVVDETLDPLEVLGPLPEQMSVGVLEQVVWG